MSGGLKIKMTISGNTYKSLNIWESSIQYYVGNVEVGMQLIISFELSKLIYKTMKMNLKKELLIWVALCVGEGIPRTQ